MSKVKCRKSTVNLGFTLIEMLIVISLIGILAAVLVSVIDPGAQQKKTRDTIRKRHTVEIGEAAEIYYAENGNYPDQSQLTGGSNPIIRNWPNGDPATAPNTYSVSTGASASSFCLHVEQEVYEGRYIRYYAGKLEENTSGCP